jgi:Site-specific recombinase XerD
MKKQSMYANVCGYIKYRKEMGYAGAEEDALKNFAAFADKEYPGNPLTISMAVQWATAYHPKKKSPRSRIQRLRSFAAYMKIRDERTELLPLKLLSAPRIRFEPYILSADEIDLFMKTDSYDIPSMISGRTLTTIVGLLACTGMRTGEILSLKNESFDWKNQAIAICNSKRKTYRLLPVDTTTIDALRSYSTYRNTLFPGNGTDYFFMQDNGKRMFYQTFKTGWRRLYTKIENKTDGLKRRCPRPYDFRHTFACNHLLNAHREGKDIHREVHLLSAYLGHKHVSSTYWYLSATPELLEHVSESFERYVNQTRKSHEK